MEKLLVIHLIVSLLGTGILGTETIRPLSVFVPSGNLAAVDSLDDQALPDDESIIYTFLTEFYCANHNQRYERFKHRTHNLLTGLDSLPNSLREKIGLLLMEKIARDYHQRILPYVSARLYTDMLNNRTMLRFDEWAEQNTVKVVPAALLVEPYSDGPGTDEGRIYKFSLQLDLEPQVMSDLAAERAEYLLEGQIRIKDQDIIGFSQSRTGLIPAKLP